MNRNRILSWVALAFGAAGLLGSIAGRLGDLWWLFGLLDHFRFQFTLLLIVGLALALFARERLRAALFGGVLAWNALTFAPLFFASIAAGRGPAIEMLHANVYHLNLHLEETLGWLAAEPGDLLFVQEANGGFREDWDELFAGWQIHGAEPNLLLIPPASQQKLEVLSAETIAVGRKQALECRIRVGNAVWTVLSLHTSPPINPGFIKRRTHQIHDVIQWSRAQSAPVVIIGDFNCTPWSRPFRRLRDGTGLVDSSLGFGYQPTWPVTEFGWFGWLARVPIDHCLHSDALVTTDRSAVDSRGSDHDALRITLQARAAD